MIAGESRGKAPVFVVGSPRSGTTLLYHMLLSAGGFAVFRAETHIFSTLAPRFGGMRTPADRRAALRVWLASPYHTLTGVERESLEQRVERECRNAGDFLRVIMDATAARQGMTRWAETTPAHVLRMPRIREQIPGALFIHVIRDGRDVAASLAQQRWVRPLPGDEGRPALAAAAFWDWTVRRGRADGALLGDDYLEVRYEALVRDGPRTLAEVGRFIDHPLDWGVVQRIAIGSVKQPNTSFPKANTSGVSSRWRTELSEEHGLLVDDMLAPTLRTLGYSTDRAASSPVMAFRRRAYGAVFSTRLWMKETQAGRWLTDLSLFDEGAVAVTDEKLVAPAATS